MSSNGDNELVAHLKSLLEKARASGGRVVVDVQDDPGAGYVLQEVAVGQYGVTLNYRAGKSMMCAAEVTTQGDDRVRKTADGLSGRDMDGEAIRVRLERG